jgi:hypothetical protein
MTYTARPCIGCVFYSAPFEGVQIHLYILPPDCAPPLARDEKDYWHEREAEGRTYLGTSCEVMRRMGAACGPHAAMSLDAHAQSAPRTAAGDNR